MSTPSPVPLDNLDPVSPYAPKWAHHQTTGREIVSTVPAHPAGIEHDHDARHDDHNDYDSVNDTFVPPLIAARSAARDTASGG